MYKHSTWLAVVLTAASHAGSSRAMELTAVTPDFFGDYYPLTPYTLDTGAWIAWQFHRPEAGRGFIQVFRRSNSDFYGAQLRLRGLRPDARYELKNLDVPGTVSVPGRQLMEVGVDVAIKQRPGAAVIVYKRFQ